MKSNEALNSISNLLNTPLFPVNIELGSRYTVKQEVASMDTWVMMKIINKFIDQVGKENILVEVSDANKVLPKLEKNIPFIVIESSYNGILNAKKNLAKRKYVTILDDDFTESDELAMMIFTVKE